MKFEVGHLYSNPGTKYDVAGEVEFIVLDAVRVPEKDDKDGKAYRLKILVTHNRNDPKVPWVSDETAHEWGGLTYTKHYDHVRKVW